MTAEALQGRALTRTIDGLNVLLNLGEVSADALGGLSAGSVAGLWSDTAGEAIAGARLVDLVDFLPVPAEAVPALFAIEPEVRAAWIPILLARLREIGERNDLAPLCDAITAVGALASELIDGVTPSLAPTPCLELERLVLPAAAHEAPAFPILLRILSATAALRSQPLGPFRQLPEIAWDNPSRTWVPGRLIRLPSREDAVITRSVLTGALDDRAGGGEPMRWVLERPWAFLLAQMVFTKEAWDAERVSGSLTLELEEAQLAVFQCPPRIEVGVTLATGEEVRCGSLGEFVRQTLGQLGVVVLGHRVSACVLDDHLGAVVEALLRHDVWRFDHGSGGRRPGYTIHPNFSDACYRALGSRAFYRLGSPLTAAIRRVAESWARDRMARAGASGPREGRSS